MLCEFSVCSVSEPARDEKQGAAQPAKRRFTRATLDRRFGFKKEMAEASFASPSQRSFQFDDRMRCFSLGTPLFAQHFPGVVTSFPNQKGVARFFPATPPSPNQALEPTTPVCPFSASQGRAAQRVFCGVAA